jgi:hypothetical protein
MGHLLVTHPTPDIKQAIVTISLSLLMQNLPIKYLLPSLFSNNQAFVNLRPKSASFLLMNRTTCLGSLLFGI